MRKTLILSLILSAYAKAADVRESVLVVRTKDQKTLLSRNPEELLTPASTLKLISSAAILKHYGPFATRKTHFYASGPISNGILKGDLIVKGGGDPFFSSESLWQISADLRNMGLTQIDGNLLIDNSLFPAAQALYDNKLAPSGRAYEAPSSALGVNFNVYTISVAPAQSEGQDALLGFDPLPLEGLTLSGHVRTVSAGKSAQVEATASGGKSLHIEVKGQVPLGQPIKKIFRSFEDPILGVGRYIRAFLGQQGVIIKGTHKAGRVPAGAKLLLTWEGKTNGELVKSLNYFSNNYFADTLIRGLGAERGGQTDELEAGLAALRSFMQDEIKASGFVLADGSGLSTGSKLSAKQLCDLLFYMTTRTDLFTDYLASLPAGAETGSLKKRFQHAGADFDPSAIRSKTGTLTEPVSVSGLAGYWQHPKQGLLAFAILQNGRSGAAQPSISELRQRQEQILQELARSL